MYLDVMSISFQGVTFPAMHAILAKWAPLYEKTRLASLIYSGIKLCTFEIKIGGASANSDWSSSSLLVSNKLCKHSEPRCGEEAKKN